VEGHPVFDTPSFSHNWNRSDQSHINNLRERSADCATYPVTKRNKTIRQIFRKIDEFLYSALSYWANLVQRSFSCLGGKSLMDNKTPCYFDSDLRWSFNVTALLAGRLKILGAQTWCFFRNLWNPTSIIQRVNALSETFSIANGNRDQDMNLFSAKL
jgi:hypothetical protein